jgi:hypothetical protein
MSSIVSGISHKNLTLETSEVCLCEMVTTNPIELLIVVTDILLRSNMDHIALRIGDNSLIVLLSHAASQVLLETLTTAPSGNTQLNSQK